MVIDVKPLQFWNELAPIEVTELGMVVVEQPSIKVFVFVLIIALQLSLESYTELLLSTVIEDTFTHPLKADPLILVTLSGMVIDVKPAQSPNTLSVKAVTCEGTTAELKAVP